MSLTVTPEMLDAACKAYEPARYIQDREHMEKALRAALAVLSPDYMTPKPTPESKP